MKIKHFVLFITTIFISSCSQQPKKIFRIEGKQILVADTLSDSQEIENYIAPYRSHLNATLDSVLCYAPNNMDKNDGALETTMGNMMADIILHQAKPIFKKRYNLELDFCLLNHGGIRGDIAKGKVTLRTAYQVMPFENTITVAELSGERIKEMLNYLAQSKRAHPIAGLTIKLDTNYQIQDARINGNPIDFSKTYLVATSNYLMSLGDNMNFFAEPVNRYDLDYKIRNAMVDYFEKIDTLEAKLDNRFIQL